MSRRRHTPEQINGKLRDEVLNGEIFYTLPGPSSSSSSGGWSHSLSGTDSFVRYTGFLDEPSCAHSYSMVA